VTDLARALAGRGHDVALFCASGSTISGVRLVEVPTGDLSGAMVRPAGGQGAVLPEMRAAFRRCYELVDREAPDAVTQHAFDAEALEEAACLRMRAVHTLHLTPGASPRVVAAARRTTQPLVTVSRTAARDWGAAGVQAEVIMNGVPDFAVEAGSVEPWALIAGRVSPEKGTHVAVRAARASGLQPRVFGTVYDPAYAAGHDIVIEGSLPRPELWRLMARCAVTLMPVEWEEPFGLIAAESQVAGTPVAGYRRGALPDIIEEGVGGCLVDAGDEAGLVKAIDRARRLDRAAVRERARLLLLIDRCAADYERVLRA
jgi:UDP-glucose:tetrahydrobiopterin glucosyltransferase